MEIVDAHHHLWDTNALYYSLFDSIPLLRRPYTLGDYQQEAERNQIEQSVCVEAASAGASGEQEMTWLLKQIGDSNLVRRIVVWAPLDQPGIRRYLQKLHAVQGGKVVGLRRSFEFEAANYPERDEVIQGIRQASHFDFLVELVAFDHSLRSIVALVRSCPETKFVLDHCGKPRIRDHITQPWKDNIAMLAELPNITCKISGLSTEADREHWTREDLKPYIDHVVAHFGWDRIVFGSDWPVCNQAGGFKAWLDAARWATQDASEANLKKLFAENARRLYRMNDSEVGDARQ